MREATNLLTGYGKLGIAIPGSRIPALAESQSRDYKNLLKLYFFACQMIEIIILASGE